jgi:hypothetical protein
MPYAKFFIAMMIFFSAVFEFQIGNAQTNLQELENQIVELEKRLANAEERQKNAYKVQMQLEEQEQKLAGLEKLDKYRVQVIEIRADISNIRVKIEALIKEKNDLEENLRIAKNMLAILNDAQIMTNQEASLESPVLANPNEIPKEKAISHHPVEKERNTTIKISADTWRLDNIKIGDYFDYQERDEIKKAFAVGRIFNRDDLVQSAYKIYNNTSIVLDLVVNTKNENSANLEILLLRRDAVGTFMTWTPLVTLKQFRDRDLRITIK